MKNTFRKQLQKEKGSRLRLVFLSSIPSFQEEKQLKKSAACSQKSAAQRSNFCCRADELLLHGRRNSAGQQILKRKAHSFFSTHSVFVIRLSSVVIHPSRVVILSGVYGVEESLKKGHPLRCFGYAQHDKMREKGEKKKG